MIINILLHNNYLIYGLATGVLINDQIYQTLQPGGTVHAKTGGATKCFDRYIIFQLNRDYIFHKYVYFFHTMLITLM